MSNSNKFVAPAEVDHEKAKVDASKEHQLGNNVRVTKRDGITETGILIQEDDKKITIETTDRGIVNIARPFCIEIKPVEDKTANNNDQTR